MLHNLALHNMQQSLSIKVSNVNESLQFQFDPHILDEIEWMMDWMRAHMGRIIRITKHFGIGNRMSLPPFTVEKNLPRQFTRCQ